MIEKEPKENQSLPSPVSPGLQVKVDGRAKNGGPRNNAGRPKGVQNKTTQTFRDLLLQAATEVGDSTEVGKDGQGGILSYLKVTAVQERRMFTLLMGRILPLKITTEVKTEKETMTIEEAVADLKALGMEPLLALYLKRYPIERDEGDPLWAKTINMDLAPDPLADTIALEETGTAEDDTGSDTEKPKEEDVGGQ